MNKNNKPKPRETHVALHHKLATLFLLVYGIDLITSVIWSEVDNTWLHFLIMPAIRVGIWVLISLIVIKTYHFFRSSKSEPFAVTKSIIKSFKVLLTLQLLFIIIITTFLLATSEYKQTTPVNEPLLIDEVDLEINKPPKKIDNYVYIKYRNDPVNVADSRFEHLDTSTSSLVRDAWYDESNAYMLIDLKGTKYQYCGMPASAWTSFKGASSYGSYYENYIKGEFDCRINRVPIY